VTLFVRPRRTAAVRTLLDAASIREKVLALAAQGASTGFFAGVFPESYFLGGWTSGDAFALDYFFGSPKHRQVYAVRGEIVEAGGQREVRLVCEARRPWIRAWLLVLLAVAAVLLVAFVHPRIAVAAGALIAVLFALHAYASLVHTPAFVRDCVARVVAARLEGRVFDRAVPE
jgi:hypothetical protein